MPKPRKDYHEAVALYRGGQSLAGVASCFQVTRQAMWAILKRRGVQFRPQRRYGKDNHFFRHGRGYNATARSRTQKAMLSGQLERQPCEACGANGVLSDGRTEVHAHHDDYNKPLEVRWLCDACHREWHNEHVPVYQAECV